MNLKRFLAYLTVYALVIISVPVIFNDMWLKNFPELKTYEGELGFSSSKAFENLKYITVNFPEREVGSENAKSSANWIEHEFEQLGLDTHKEEFQCSMPDGEADDLSMNGLFDKVTGINVIGTSRGKSSDIIIIGAHRDTIGTIEGAQDNASGTASMLELARILTSDDHYYTYMFISFDGEEIGLKGSEAFAESHSLENIRLAMILDCVGYKDADTAGLYQFVSAKGASPLWTTALANNLISSRNRAEYYLDNEGGFRKTGIGIFNPLMNRLVSQRVSGNVNTDTGPFVDRNIPSVGFIAANSDRIVDSEGLFHTENDTISYISEDTLDFIGKLSEQYIKSVELNDFTFELNSNLYLVTESKYLGFANIAGFMILIILACLILWLMSSIDVVRNPRAFLSFLKGELPWIVSVFLVSGLSAFFWQMLKFNIASELNILILVLLWLFLSVFGIVIVIVLRFSFMKGNRDRYFEITKNQKILLNTIYTLVFLALAAYFNIFTAIILVGSPLLIMGRVGFKNLASRIIWGVVLVIWIVIQAILFFTCLEAYLFDMLAMKAALLIFTNNFLIISTITYVISSPALPGQQSNMQWSDIDGDNNRTYKY